MNYSTGRTPQLRPNQLRMLDLITQGRSTSSAVLAERFGCTPEHAMTIIRRLRERGLVCCIFGGASARWVLTSLSAEEREKHRIATRLSLNESQRRYKLEKKMRAEEENEEFVLAKPRQITVPAHQCAPIRPRAPASVFNLAQHA
jgi:DNA-binding MarR family transcriptional regulator